MVVTIIESIFVSFRSHIDWYLQPHDLRLRQYRLNNLYSHTLNKKIFKSWIARSRTISPVDFTPRRSIESKQFCSLPKISAAIVLPNTDDQSSVGLSLIKSFPLIIKGSALTRLALIAFFNVFKQSSLSSSLKTSRNFSLRLAFSFVSFLVCSSWAFSTSLSFLVTKSIASFIKYSPWGLSALEVEASLHGVEQLDFARSL